MTSLYHLALPTAQVDESSRFDDAVLSELGYKRSHTSERPCTWLGDGPEVLRYIVEEDDHAPHTLGGPGWHHAAFRVDTVHAVHRAARAGG